MMKNIGIHTTSFDGIHTGTGFVLDDQLIRKARVKENAKFDFERIKK